MNHKRTRRRADRRSWRRGGYRIGLRTTRNWASLWQTAKHRCGVIGFMNAAKNWSMNAFLLGMIALELSLLVMLLGD